MDAAKSIATQFQALADEISLRIVGILAKNRSKPISVRAVANELHISKSAAGTRLQHLFDVSLISRQSSRQGSYLMDDSTELRAVIGPRSYQRITQDLGDGQNENVPGLS